MGWLTRFVACRLLAELHHLALLPVVVHHRLVQVAAHQVLHLRVIQAQARRLVVAHPALLHCHLVLHLPARAVQVPTQVHRHPVPHQAQVLVARQYLARALVARARVRQAVQVAAQVVLA